MKPKIVVPLDGHALSEEALPWAGLLAETLGADLVLMQAHADEPSGAAAHVYLSSIASTLPYDMVGVSVCVFPGAPADCILREARMVDAAMIVMATHARWGLDRAVLGSVADSVLAHSMSPVLLIRAGLRRRPRLQTVLVAVGPTSVAPLPTTLRIASAAGARVVLLHVTQPSEFGIWQWQRGQILEEPQAVVTARQELADVAVQLDSYGVRAEAWSEIGQPVPTINAVAEAVNADMIVMATHARTGADRILEGSVSNAVVRSSTRPVLVCRVITPRERLLNGYQISAVQ